MFKRNIAHQVVMLLPGIILALFIAAIAKYIENSLPVHLIGASIIALFIGMIINHFKKPNPMIKRGLTFTSKNKFITSFFILSFD